MTLHMELVQKLWTAVISAIVTNQGKQQLKLPGSEFPSLAPITAAGSGFANSPDLDESLMNAIMEALDAHNLMSSQALSSEAIRKGLKAILLGPAKLYESLRDRTPRQLG